MFKKELNRIRRKNKIRAKVSWTAKRPRLAIFRSNTNIYAQLIDDEKSKTLWEASDLKIKEKLNKTKLAEKVWEAIAKKAKELKVKEVVFDRGGFIYHWRIKALADSARKTWLKF